MTAHGYGLDTWWGENVFAGDQTATGAFAWWQASPGHNANMLSPNLVAIGIALAYDADSTYGWYWTTSFGGVADGAACFEPPGAGQPPAGVDDPLMPGGDLGNDNDGGDLGNGGEVERFDGDEDGLYDDDETDYYTDPYVYDTDGAGDGEEVYFGTDPANADDF